MDHNKLLWEFSNGEIGILVAVDVLNEGIDVPDVNLVAFLRVTHSRRIFVQQLGRGLRLAKGKDKVIVLDFAQDIRLVAQVVHWHKSLGDSSQSVGPQTISVGSSFRFLKANGEDPDGASFLRAWLGEAEAIAGTGEDVSVLSFPDPSLVPDRE